MRTVSKNLQAGAPGAPDATANTRNSVSIAAVEQPTDQQLIELIEARIARSTGPDVFYSVVLAAFLEWWGREARELYRPECNDKRLIERLQAARKVFSKTEF